MSAAVAESSNPMAAMKNRLNFFIDSESDNWLEEQYVADGIKKAARIRALITLARTDPEVAARAAQIDAEQRRKRGSA